MISFLLWASIVPATPTPQGTTEPYKAGLPVVAVTSENPTDLDVALSQVGTHLPGETASGDPRKYADTVRRAESMGYVRVLFPKFQVYAHPNFLRIREAERQIRAMADISALLARGERTFDLDSLPDESRRTIRGMLPHNGGSPGPWDQFSLQPGLKLKIGITTKSTLEYKGKELDLWLPPKGPTVSEVDSTATGLKPAKEWVKVAKEDFSSPAQTSLTLLFPLDIGQRRRLEWSELIFKHFLETCQTLRTSYSTVARDLVVRLMKDEPGRYGSLREGEPLRFSDLQRDQQHVAEQIFAGMHQAHFKDSGEVTTFLNNASSKRMEATLTLSAYFVEGRSENHATLRPIPVRFDCPLDSIVVGNPKDSSAIRSSADWRPDLPTLIVTTTDITEAERRTHEAIFEENLTRQADPNHRMPPAQGEVAKLLRAGYRIKNLNGFQILYHRNTFNLHDALAQSQLMEDLVPAVKSEARTIEIADLSLVSQSTLRGMFNGKETSVDSQIRSLPALNASLSMGALFKIPNNDKPLQLLVTDDSTTVASGSAAGPKLVHIDPSSLAREPRPPLTALFPLEMKSIDRLLSVQKVRDFFAEECEVATKQYSAAGQKLQQRLQTFAKTGTLFGSVQKPHSKLGDPEITSMAKLLQLQNPYAHLSVDHAKAKLQSFPVRVEGFTPVLRATFDEGGKTFLSTLLFLNPVDQPLTPLQREFLGRH